MHDKGLKKSDWSVTGLKTDQEQIFKTATRLAETSPIDRSHRDENDTATNEIYALSQNDAPPTSG